MIFVPAAVVKNTRNAAVPDLLLFRRRQCWRRRGFGDGRNAVNFAGGKMKNRYWLMTVIFAWAAAMSSGAVYAQDAAGIQAAHRLFQTLNMPSQQQRVMAILVEEQLRLNPKLRPYKEVIWQSMQQNLAWNNIKDSMARLYAKEFSARELNEINAFYSTPTGKKMSGRFVELVYRTAEICKKRMQVPVFSH